MPCTELAEWMAFYQIDPFGDQRADTRAAMLATVMAKLWSDDKGPEPKIEEFMLFQEKATPQPKSETRLTGKTANHIAKRIIRHGK